MPSAPAVATVVIAGHALVQSSAAATANSPSTRQSAGVAVAFDELALAV
jgi:hypothetical protein